MRRGLEEIDMANPQPNLCAWRLLVWLKADLRPPASAPCRAMAQQLVTVAVVVVAAPVLVALAIGQEDP